MTTPNLQPAVRFTFLSFVFVSVFGFVLIPFFGIQNQDSQLAAQQPAHQSDETGAEFFESNIKPIFEQHCFKCHGAGEKVRGALVLTNRDDLLKGGESGKAVDLEAPLESLLLSAVNYDDYEMPPSGKLPAADIKKITQWIEMGAPWSGEGFAAKSDRAEKMAPEVNDETKKWWSFQKPVRPPVPAPDDTERHPIDQFIVQQLSDAGLSPNPRADKRTLIRRATYDLTGLPPTPEEVQSFLADESEKAYEKLLDRLLQSKHYGEKWGRHWLDLVRYAESNSYERDGTKPFVWRYRDYVIQALNTDKPYDEFIRQQLAGDEVDPKQSENLIATGYYRLGLWDDEPVDPKQAWFDDTDDILKTTSDVFLGLTVGCARCHDHKIDPVPQSDYYRLLAFFRGVQRYGVRGHDTVIRQSTRPIVPSEQVEQHDKDVKQHRQAMKEAEKTLREIEKIVKKDFIPVEHEEFRHEMNRVPLVKKRIGKEIDDQTFTESQFDTYESTFKEWKRLRRSPPAQLERALCITEKRGELPDTFVMIRGNAHAPSDKVLPGFPTVLSPPDPEIKVADENKSSGRRLALANWIASPDNPLTARVMVNRIWQHHFGRGIVRSSSDFGFQGTAPTHPELLDWLAVEFSDGGWKLKRMHKMIMTSQAYCMSSTGNSAALAKDPLNDGFWRYDMRRLTAEEVRDSILSVNGTLNKNKMFGPSIFPKLEPEVLHGQSRPGENWGNSSPDDLRRRSIYIHIKRSLPVPIMASFDAADPDSSCAVRFNTVQPTQALGMLNSRFINKQAEKLAEMVTELHPKKLDEQINTILFRVTQRTATDEEVKRGREFIESLRKDGSNEFKSLQLYCVVALNLNEFLYLD